MITIINELNLATNCFGRLSVDCRRSIIHYIQNSTPENWSKIAGIIINGHIWLTIWQAVIEVDPTFPRIGRSVDLTGSVIREWSVIPSLEILKKALFYGTH